MTVSCSSARDLFAPYLDEALARAERSEVRVHLTSCAACRGAAMAYDPVLLFAVTPEESVSPADAAGILTAVRAGIALKAAESRIRSGARAEAPNRRSAVAAAAAAAVVLLMWTSSPNVAVPPEESPAIATGPAGAAASLSGSYPAAMARTAAALAPFPSGPVPGSSAPRGGEGRTVLPFGKGAAAATAPNTTPGNLPADATIYNWNPGGDQPRVVWIVDRSLDI